MASEELICSPQSSIERTDKHGSNPSPSLRHKRNLANLRERKRMMLINKGFELLRNRLPIRELVDIGSNRNLKNKLKADRWATLNAEVDQRTLLESNERLRLTKVDILKLTIEYIKQLNRILSGSDVQATTLSLNFDHNRYVRRSKMSKKYYRKKYRDRYQHSKRVNKQQQQQIQDVKFLKQTTSHIFVYVKSNMNLDENTEHDIVTTTTRRYLLSCSRSVDKYGYDQSECQKLHGDGKKSLDLKDTKLWIPGTE